MVVHKNISWPNLGCSLWCAVCCSRSRIHSKAGSRSCSAMTQHYPTTSAAAAVWPSGHFSLFLLYF